jgi:hypothetical protein
MTAKGKALCVDGGNRSPHTVFSYQNAAGLRYTLPRRDYESANRAVAANVAAGTRHDGEHGVAQRPKPQHPFQSEMGRDRRVLVN